MRDDNRRYGRISFSVEFIDIIRNNFKKEYVKAFLDMFLVLRSDINYCTNCIEWTVYCEHFDNISPEERIPEYVLEFTQCMDNDNNLVGFYVSSIRRIDSEIVTHLKKPHFLETP